MVQLIGAANEFYNKIRRHRHKARLFIPREESMFGEWSAFTEPFPIKSYGWLCIRAKTEASGCARI